MAIVPPPFPIGKLDRASMRFDDPARDREAKSGAGWPHFSRTRSAIEALEQTLAVRLVEADAGVLDADDRSAVTYIDAGRRRVPPFGV